MGWRTRRQVIAASSMDGWRKLPTKSAIVNPIDAAWQRIYACREAGDRPVAWPRTDVGLLLKAKPGDDAYLFSYLVAGYVALDEGKVDDALDSFLDVARRTTDAPDYSVAWLEVAFILSAYYHRPDAARRWLEAGHLLAGSCNLSLSHRVMWSIHHREGNMNDAEKHFVLHNQEESTESGFEAERDWIQMAIDGDWDEAFPEDIQPFYLNQYLNPPPVPDHWSCKP